MKTLKEIEAGLLGVIAGSPAVLGAYSGGVDSTLVAVAAHKVLGDKFTAVIADSPSLPRAELTEAKQYSERFGFQLRVIHTQETSDPRYLQNPKNRCYFCKSELYTTLQKLLPEMKAEIIFDGANLDDLGDYRPGRQAAAETQVRSPLIEAQLKKSQVRELAKAWGLPNWDKPAMPCLASRVPYGESIDLAKLSRIEKAETFFRERGLKEVRVRHHGPVARIEVPQGDFEKVMSLRGEATTTLLGLGFSFVSLDLQGLRSGSLNQGIKDPITSSLPK